MRVWGSIEGNKKILVSFKFKFTEIRGFLEEGV